MYLNTYQITNSIKNKTIYELNFYSVNTDPSQQSNYNIISSYNYLLLNIKPCENFVELQVPMCKIVTIFLPKLLLDIQYFF